MTDDLLKALQLIKETCEKQGEKCEECPLYSASDSECGIISESPYDWRLQKREVYF